jgi:hypothetical protein
MGEAEGATAPARVSLGDTDIEDRCMRCGSLIEKDRIRIIPPRYVQDRDPYVRAGLVRRRIMCVSCYNRPYRNRTASRFARGFGRKMQLAGCKL